MFKTEIQGQSEADCLVCDAVIYPGSKIIKLYRTNSGGKSYQSGMMHERCALLLFAVVLESCKVGRESVSDGTPMNQ